MKTRIILHGGFKPGEKQVDPRFFSEILKTAPARARVLLVYFADDSAKVDRHYRDDIESFGSIKGSLALEFTRATEAGFLNEVASSDVIYLHGGSTGPLLDTLRKFPGFSEAVRGKIIAGDSAGANVLCSAFYSMKVGAGLGFGIVPFKIISHFREENAHTLDGIEPERETIFLREYETKVCEV